MPERAGGWPSIAGGGGEEVGLNGEISVGLP
jgi:hypothetical protein